MGILSRSQCSSSYRKFLPFRCPGTWPQAIIRPVCFWLTWQGEHLGGKFNTQGFGSMTFWAFLLVSLESLEPSILSSTGHPILSGRNSPLGCAEASRKVTWFGGERALLTSRGSADVCGALALPQALFQVPGTCKVQKYSSYPRGFHSSGRRQTRNKISASHVSC